MGDRKVALSVLLVLSVVFFSFLQIGIVKAQESSIFIRDDGSIEGTDRIHRDGDVYTFTGDVSGSIRVERNFTIIDGAGYTLQGNGEPKGIDLTTLAPEYSLIVNITVKNLQIKNFNTGIYSLNNNTFIGNFITDCDTGINIIGGTNNLIENNTIANNVNGISIAYSGGNHTISQNNMINDKVASNNVIIVWMAPEPTVDRNYWSDYTGYDNNGDGIGDTPYIYLGTDYAKYVDNHPLIEPLVPIIPEFPAWIILPLFLTFTVFALLFIKKLDSRIS